MNKTLYCFGVLVFIEWGNDKSVHSIINNVMQCGEGIECKRYTAILHGFNENHSKAFEIAGHATDERFLIEFIWVLESIESDAFELHISGFLLEGLLLLSPTYDIKTIAWKSVLELLPNVEH